MAIIRKAGISDYEKLKEIKSEFFIWCCSIERAFNPDFVKRGLPARLGRNLRQKNVAFFIAADKGNIIGYAGIEITKNDKAFRKPRQAHLFNLYVRPAGRKRGIAKKLIKACLAWSRKKGVGDPIIRARFSNKLAQAIYRKCGWKDHVIEFWREA